MQNGTGEAGDDGAGAAALPAAIPAPANHPLLDELKGLLRRLQGSSQPIKDGQEHVVLLCETVEAIYRKGLKKPTSLFGLNKQDYWSWIKTLPDYYFLDKQNPLLRQVVQSIASSNKCRSVVGRGRCFIRVSLCRKLITVPIEHLVKNERHTNYWYSAESIIGDQALRASLMQLLFQVTELDFDLDVEHSSFLDESWIVPVYKKIPLPPLKQLDLRVSYVEDRALIVEVEEGCLAEKNGVERGDILDELCGDPVLASTHGKLKQVLQTNSELNYATDIVIVKSHLLDGCPFQPILRRQHIHDTRATPTEVKFEDSEGGRGKRRPSLVVQTQGLETEYSLVCLGQDSCLNPKEIQEQTVDEAISQILHSHHNSQEVVLKVNPSLVTILSSDRKEILGKFAYSDMGGCGRGVAHQTCLTVMAREPGSRSLCVYVLETPSSELAHAICTHIAQGFNQSTSGKSSPFEELT